MLGILLLLIFVVLPIVLAVKYIKSQGGPVGMAAKKRDREIETAMRLGVRDGLAQERIARKILEERDRGY
jgi:hypothetical protein